MFKKIGKFIFNILFLIGSIRIILMIIDYLKRVLFFRTIMNTSEVIFALIFITVMSLYILMFVIIGMNKLLRNK